MEDIPKTLSALADTLRLRSVSPVEITESCLGRIEADDTNAFITVTAERAMAAAKRAEREIQADEYRGPLHGVPIALKDIVFTEDVRTTMGSAFFENFIPDESATVVAKLEEAGAVVVGKTNTHEFAYGPTGDISHFGPMRNPRDRGRITGGSSGGSGAAVADGLCYGAIGSDTGGSIRIPAALCSIVGMKPTFGRVSKHGVFPLAWTLDHIGPLTRTVEGNALFLNAIVGHDPRDPYSVDLPAEDIARDLRRGVGGTVIGVPRDFYFEGIEEEVESLVREAAGVFRSLGAEVREVEIPNLQETLATHRLTLAAEAYAVHEERLETSPEKFGDQVRERLLAGGNLSAPDYAKAQRRKLWSRREFENVLERVDVILAPTVPIPATEIGQRQTNIRGREEDIFSTLTRLNGPTNLNGLPSLSVPCGLNADGLPAGIQLIGRLFDEATLYRFGHAYEEAVRPADD